MTQNNHLETFKDKVKTYSFEQAEDILINLKLDYYTVSRVHNRQARREFIKQQIEIILGEFPELRIVQ